jgi:3-carboxymuconate cyclase
MKFTIANSSNTFSFTKDYSSTAYAGETLSFTNIVVGTSYTITVRAYSDASASTQIAQGVSASFDVVLGTPATPSVTISFTQTGTGGFTLPISWPNTSLGYVYANLDSAGGATVASATGSSGSATLTSTVAIASGSHSLYIYFKTSSSATTSVGPFVESLNVWDGVTDTQWADSSGTLLPTLTLDAADFADTTCTLAGLGVSTLGLGTSFAAGTTSYSFGSSSSAWLTPGESYAFTITAASAAQGIAAAFNGTTLSLTATSATLLSGSLTAVSGANSLAITVTAPDRTTASTYTIAWTSGSSDITISVADVASYEDLAFPSSATILQGDAFGVESGNAVLDAITTGWTWWLGGTEQTSQTSQRFALSPSLTASMIGTYSIEGMVSVTSGGTTKTYSGRFPITVTRRSSLGLTSANAVVTQVAASTTFSNPRGLVANNDVLYIADCQHYKIWQMSISSGTVSTFAGTGTQGSTDGATDVATLYFPRCLATDGLYIYFTEQTNNKIRKIAISTGYVSTLAGSGTPASTDGTGTGASFSSPCGIATDGSYVYVSDQGTSKIRKIAIATGVVTTLASTSGLAYPQGMTLNGDYLYIAGNNAQAIHKVAISDGTTTTLAGSGSAGSTDADGTSASFKYPYDVTNDGSYLYVADTYNHVIRKVSLESPYTVTTIAGTAGSTGTTNATGASARFTYPNCITTDGTYLYVADTNNNMIRKIAK